MTNIQKLFFFTLLALESLPANLAFVDKYTKTVVIGTAGTGKFTLPSNLAFVDEYTKTFVIRTACTGKFTLLSNLAYIL